jgi:hypothetical protein
MKPLPDKRDLDIMWAVATSTSIETGTRPYYGFSQMLYDYFIDKHSVRLHDENYSS